MELFPHFAKSGCRCRESIFYNLESVVKWDMPLPSKHTRIEKGLFTRMVIIDLPMTFDTIDQQVLLKKKKDLGFYKNTITWFKSYLCERKFKISINTSYSSPASLLCGVSQGSILGPLLFLLDISDLPQAVVSDLLLYVDDNCIVFQHKSETEIEKQLIKDFSSLYTGLITTN